MLFIVGVIKFNLPECICLNSARDDRDIGGLKMVSNTLEKVIINTRPLGQHMIEQQNRSKNLFGSFF